MKAQFGIMLDSTKPMPHVKSHAEAAQAIDPASQQWCGFHFLGIHTTAACLKCLDAQTCGPISYILWRKIGEPLIPRCLWHVGAAIACAKRIHGLAMSEIESATTCDKKFPSHRWHRIVEIHLDALICERFCRKQARRSSTDYGDSSCG